MSALRLPPPAIGVESYMHRAAKEVLARWLRQVPPKHDPEVGYLRLGPLCWRPNRGGPNYGVWTEYPFLDGPGANGEVWDEYLIGDFRDENSIEPFRLAPPTVEQVSALGFRTFCVADIAIQHKGYISSVIEVVHKHPVSFRKRKFYADNSIELYEVKASWVLGQVTRPDSLKLIGSSR